MLEGLFAVQSAEAGKATGSHDVPSKLAKEGWLVLVGVLSEAKNWARDGEMKNIGPMMKGA